MFQPTPQEMSHTRRWAWEKWSLLWELTIRDQMTFCVWNMPTIMSWQLWTRELTKHKGFQLTRLRTKEFMRWLCRNRMEYAQNTEVENIQNNPKLRQLQILSQQNNTSLVSDFRKMLDVSRKQVRLGLSQIIRQLLKLETFMKWVRRLFQPKRVKSKSQHWDAKQVAVQDRLLRKIPPVVPREVF